MPAGVLVALRAPAGGRPRPRAPGRCGRAAARRPRGRPRPGRARPTPMSAQMEPAAQAAPRLQADVPGLNATKVTVSSARTAAPRTAPVSPSSPLGTSTARTGRSLGVDGLDQRRGPRRRGRATARPRTARRSPDRRPATPSGAPFDRRARPAPRRPRAASPVQRGTGSRGGRRRPRIRPRRERAPPRSRRRRCCPVPHSTRARPGRGQQGAGARSATAAPAALHQSVEPGDAPGDRRGIDLSASPRPSTDRALSHRTPPFSARASIIGSAHLAHHSHRTSARMICVKATIE